MQKKNLDSSINFQYFANGDIIWRQKMGDYLFHGFFIIADSEPNHYLADKINKYFNKPLIKNFEYMNQQHGKNIIHLSKQIDKKSKASIDKLSFNFFQNKEPCDGITTDKNSSGLLIKSADCVPVIIYSAKGQMATLHSGWRSTLGQIVNHFFQEFYFDDIKTVKVLLGPAISSSVFEVGLEVINAFKEKILWKNSTAFYQEHQIKFSRYYLDLKKVIYQQLSECKVEISQIFNLDICTYLDTRYPSHRRDKSQKRIWSGIFKRERNEAR